MIDGKSEVGGFPVERRPMRQWMLRITAFAERLIDELEGLDWPEGIKLLQRNWIGQSEGAEIDFPVAGIASRTAVSDRSPVIRVFTTRPDTLYGATYMVLAPEHSLIDLIVTEEQWPAVREYRERTARKSELERTESGKRKNRRFYRGICHQPGEQRQIFRFGLQIMFCSVTAPVQSWPCLHTTSATSNSRINSICRYTKWCSRRSGDPVGFVGEGTAINSPLLNGLPRAEAKKKITAWLEEHLHGKRAINYKLRDWLFSRQRYWGEPFPIVWEDGASSRGA